MTRRIELLADKHADRVVEIFSASATSDMATHGHCLDLVRAARDDGDYFALIDTDIKAKGPFLAPVLELVNESGVAAVCGGRGVWCENDVIPEGHWG